MEKIILLNSDYSYLNVINWKRAIKLIVREKVEVIKYSNKIIHSVKKSIKILVPKIIKLVKMIRTIYRTKVPFSKRNVLIRDNYTCQYCNFHSIDNMTIDHVIPIYRGGKSNFSNCVAACKKCNTKKGSHLLSEIKMYLNRQPFNPTIMEFIKIKMKNLGIDKFLDDLYQEL